MNKTPKTELEFIVEWLSYQRGVAVEMKEGKGYFVGYTTEILLQDGQTVKVVPWLLEKGIHDGMLIGNYSVKHHEWSEEYPEERLFFYLKRPVKAPF